MDSEPPKPDKPLFSKTIRPCGLLYYFDIYPGKNGGSLFLKMTHFTKDRDGNRVKHYLYLFPEAVKEALLSLQEADEFLDAYESTGA